MTFYMHANIVLKNKNKLKCSIVAVNVVHGINESIKYNSQLKNLQSHRDQQNFNLACCARHVTHVGLSHHIWEYLCSNADAGQVEYLG